MNSKQGATQLLATWWRQRRCPIVNGKLDAQDRFIPVDAKMTFDLTSKSRATRFALLRGAPMSLSALHSKGALEFTQIAEMVDETKTDEDRNPRAYCGQGAWGSEGFVALARADTDEPIWIAVFDNSNPFISIALDRECVAAKTTLDNEWRFLIDSPENLEVTYEEDRRG
jgi:hypothetical protein